MAGRASLNAKSLEALGAARLAELLLLHTQGNAAARRALRLAVAEQHGHEEMAQQVRKRLTTLQRSERWLDQKELRPLLQDLESQRLAICGPIAEQAPGLAVELLWRFLDLADSLLARIDDSEDEALQLFHRVSADLGRLAVEAQLQPAWLVDQVAEVLFENDHGQYDLLISHLAEALQTEGLLQLRQRLAGERPGLSLDDFDLPEEDRDDPDDEGVLIEENCLDFEPWSPFALAHDNEDEDAGHADSSDLWINSFEADGDDEDAMSPWERAEAVRLAMLAIADGLGDAEAYLAEYRNHLPRALRRPRIAAHVAQRFIAAGHPDQALLHLDRAVLQQGLRSDGAQCWLEARLEALEAMGRSDEAQRLRYRFALERLSLPHLRAYLEQLPAFEDGEAEERALDAVLQHSNTNQALEFLRRWSDPHRAARLISEQPECLDTADEELLEGLSQILGQHDQPLAASLCLRARVEWCLQRGRSRDYGQAVRHLENGLRLAASIKDWGKAQPHNIWVTNLLWFYSHKQAFLDKLDFDPHLPELES